MQDINTILENLQSYPPSLQLEALQLLRKYIEDSEVPGIRRVEIAQAYNRVIDQTTFDEQQKKLLKDGLPDLSHYQHLRHLEETVLLMRTPDPQALSSIVSDLKLLRPHMSREEYLKVLNYVHNHIKVAMFLISHQKPDQNPNRREDWIGFDTFLERTLKPLFMEAGGLPNDHPDFDSRMPEPN
jgi:secreted Zn-dependent insulinase-like peptidase